MKYLIDASVLSEPTRPAPDPKVVEWLSGNESNLFINSIILGELTAGVLALPSGRKRTQLEKWLDTLVRTIDCLPWDAGSAGRWAELVVRLKKQGKTMPVLDSMIAASALQHGLTVATHNVRDFKSAGVRVHDPFE